MLPSAFLPQRTVIGPPRFTGRPLAAGLVRSPRVSLGLFLHLPGPLMGLSVQQRAVWSVLASPSDWAPEVTSPLSKSVLV